MSNVEDCDFCDRTNFGQRVIRTGDLFTSFVSRPWFRSGHCLVIPNEHREEIADMNSDEMSSILAEVGRLCLKLNEGYGTGMTQKYQPLQTENGIKINHLHFHVFPRLKHEVGLFPVPVPNSFEGFVIPSDDEVFAVRNRVG